ncbi:MAG TPA: glycosyltransferase family A protein [Rudaea sp.]|nr:glycosyltransferase family A protein [Rudaea sp.]
MQQALQRVGGQPGVACVVVDYACPDQTADWVAANFSGVKLVRVTGEAGFRASHARNFGPPASIEEWLAFFDADILWSPKLAKHVIPRLQTGHFYRAQPITLQLQIRQELFNRIKRSLSHTALARKRNASVERNVPALRSAPPPINCVVGQWRLNRKLT